MTRPLDRWVRCASLIIFVLLRIWLWRSTSYVAPMPDSPGYLAGVDASWSDVGLWCGQRPPVVPVIYKLLHGSPTRIALFQLVLSVFSWCTLAMAATLVLGTRWLRFAASTGVLVLASLHEVVLWDRELLSESVALSLLALFAATWFFWIEKPTRVRAALLCGVGWLWGWTKDTNAWVLATAAFVCLAAATLAASRRAQLAAIAAVFLVAFVLVGRTADQAVAFATSLGKETCATVRPELEAGSPRWAFSLTNTIGARIMPNARYREWFVARGMPADPVSWALSERWVDDDQFRSCPSLEFGPMQRWIRTEGKRAYVRFLLSHPTWLLEAPMTDGNSLFASTASLAGEPLRSHGFRTFLPASIEDMLFARTIAHTAGMAMLVLLGVALACAARWPRSGWLVPLGLVILAWPHALVVWHGDSMEVTRHALQMNVQLRLGAWVLALYVIDSIAARRTQRAP